MSRSSKRESTRDPLVKATRKDVPELLPLSRVSSTGSTSSKIQELAQKTKRMKYVCVGGSVILALIIIVAVDVATRNRSTPSHLKLGSVVIATHDRKSAADAAYTAMFNSDTSFQSLDGVVQGAQWCQSNCNIDPNTGQKNINVDTEGNVTQSAMCIWGPTMETGSVANLYDIEDVVGVAKHVLLYTEHAMIVSEAATRFAVQNGFKRTQYYNTTKAQIEYETWLASNCSTNYWRNVNGKGCDCINGLWDVDAENDVNDITGCRHKPAESGSIGLIAIDDGGQMALATYSNGLNHKLAGRVSDAAIPGAGGYIDPSVGGCTATGDGDIIIKFSPAKAAVRFMKAGSTPHEAVQQAVDEIQEFCDGKEVVVLCLSKDGVPAIANNKQQGKSKYAYRSSRCEGAVSADRDTPRGNCV